LNIHEFQAKELLAKYGLNVPAGRVVSSGEQAEQVANDLKSKKYVIKAQIHAGGRGKGGGVKFASSVKDVVQLTNDIIGMKLVTHQTGPEGKIVSKVLVEEASDIEKEFYLGMVIDRSNEKIVVMASSEGGVEIEEVARKTPNKIIKQYVDITVGLLPYQARNIAYFLNLDGKSVNKAVNLILKLYKLFIDTDCSLAEINPMILTKSGDIVPLDAKLNIDDNALFRQKEISEYHDPDEEDPIELEAKKWGISYVKLDGNIGCLVNGAGLAMSTMDIIKYHGGEPANFLDVGGGASTEQVTQAFKMILSDSNVKAIFVNIFGGIMKCDTIANGIVSAAKEVGLDVPLVVRLEGTNVELGKNILSNSDLNIITGIDMKECAAKVVEAVNNQ
jgi:succinyl-CoA synthetase beta subunit